MNPEKELLLNEALDRVCNIGWGLESDELLENYFSERAMIIGTTADELFFNLDGMRTLIRRQKEQSTGLDLHFTRIPIFRNYSGDDNVAVIVENVAVAIQANNETIRLDIRSSAIMEYLTGGWKLIHWHASKPEMVQSDTDTFGIEDWKQKTDALEKLVAERTADLVIKNRELEIETALEKVRSRTMAMRHSAELADTASVLFQQIKGLGFETWSCGFGTWQENDVVELWMGAAAGGLLPPMKIPYKEEVTHRKIYESFQQEQESHEQIWTGKALQQHYAFLRETPSVAAAIDQLEEAGMSLPYQQCYYASFFHGGYLLLITQEPNTQLSELSKRFAKVFEQTYTRFLDLKKAEAQAREAKIENALEKVRSRTMGMQHSDELADASFVLDSQVRALGIETWGCAFNIYGPNESTEWFSSAQGTLPAYRTPRENLFLRYYEAGQAGASIHVESFSGEACAAHYEYLCTIPLMGDALRAMLAAGGSFPVQQTDHVVYFRYGYLLFITLSPVPEAHHIFTRFAKVFEQTYTRFLDLQKAEAQALRAEQDVTAIKQARQKAEEALSELQAAQKQLIQSEKMASLGELTAGIAHEIQNPLNFVNNFSELSKELLEEMKTAIESGDHGEAITLSADIIQNLEKIHYHGKRADSIVKGMLQHSRTSGGQKEPADINALVDEYLRLSYHGLRAKDKNFNATLKTSFDSSIGTMEIVPQDIGRVILNLVNNAFYAVDEKRRVGIPGYAPTVSVRTKKTGDQVQIEVSDNGKGIPPNIAEKIFQPFFTTKPTGQGTGLGLSLSYDIIKAHGGELKADTREGEGTTFVITLNTNSSR